MISLIWVGTHLKAQNFVFAELQGSPTLNTDGWNLTGNATVGNTNGTPGTNNDELILTQSSNNQSGGVFWNQEIDLNICTKWIVEFDFRIFDGNGADGLAFCFLDVPPTGFVSGGGVGIPAGSNGLKVVIDTYDNCGGPNPQLQIYSGVGYNECINGIIVAENNGGIFNFIRNNSYRSAKITYDDGNVEVEINGTTYLTGFAPANFSGFMGFTASTGGARDRHSIKNVTIYTEQAVSEAGSDVEICSGQSVEIGTNSNPDYVYSWSPATGLSDANISNPTFTMENNGTESETYEFVVETSLVDDPGVCPTTDTVVVTVHPFPVSSFSLPNEVCFNDTIMISSEGTTSSTANYEWSIEDAIIIEPTSDTEKEVYWTSAGEKTVSLTISENGCSTDTSATIEVFPTSEVNLSETFCDNATWNNQNITESGTYTYLTNNMFGCDSLVILEATVNYSTSSTESFTTCDSYFWNNQTYTASGSYDFITTNSVGCDSTVTLDLIIHYSDSLTLVEEVCDEYIAPNGDELVESGSYEYLFQTVNGCDSLVILDLTVYETPTPSISATPETGYAPLEVVFTNSSTDDGTTFWMFGDGTEYMDNEANVSHTYNEPGEYIAIIEMDNNGCSNADLITITVIPPEVSFDLPNVFTPNGDGVNDLFHLINTDAIDNLSSFEISIVNRWGNTIQVFDDQNFNWDGRTASGDNCSEGVYFYYIKAVRSDGFEMIKNGFVHLVRD